MLGGNCFFEGFAGVMACNLRHPRSDKTPAIVRGFYMITLEHDDVPQEIFEIAGCQIRSRGHGPIARFGAPELQKACVERIPECKRGVAEVMPLLLRRPLVKGSRCSDDIHASILDPKR